MRNNSDLALKIQDFIRGFTYELVTKDHLIPNLCKAIQTLDSLLSSEKLKNVENSLLILRRLASEAILLTIQDMRVTMSDYTAIMTLLLKLTEKINFEDPHIIILTTNLTMALMLILDPRRNVQEGHDTIPNPMVKDAEFLDKVNDDLTKFARRSTGFEVCLGLAYSTCLAIVAPTSQSIQNTMKWVFPKLDKMSKLVGSETFQSYQRVAHWTFILHKLFFEISVNDVMHKIFEETLLNEGQHKKIEIMSTFESASHHLLDTLNLLTQIYKNAPPEFTMEFLEGKLQRFLKICSTPVYKIMQVGHDTPVLWSYFDFLSSLVANEACAERVYTHIRNSSLNWEYIHEYINLFVKLGEPEKALPHALKLVAKLVGASHKIAKEIVWLLESIFLCTNMPSFATRGQAFETLASFGKYKEFVSFIWKQLENAEFVTGNPNEGMKKLLGQEEAHEEHLYHATTGFLHLLNTLLAFGVVDGLGDGKRAPGVNPYLEFVMMVFVDTFRRRYATTEEKWKMTYLSLQIFLRIMSTYEVNESDFENIKFKLGSEEKLRYKPPGWELFKAFLVTSPMRNTLTQIIKLGHENLVRSRSLAGGEYYEVCVLLSLQVIHECIQNSLKFVSASLAKPGHSNQIKAEKFDNETIIEISKYLEYDANSQLRYFTCLILYSFSQTNDLLVLFKNSPGHMHLFKSILLSNLEEDYLPEESISTNTEDDYANKKRLILLDLLLLKNSFALHLLGFATLVDSKQTLSSGENCLSKLVDLLNQPNYYQDFPEFTCKSLELIYKVCSDAPLHEEVFDFLQKREFLKFAIQFELHSQPVFNLVQRAWILKIIALQIYTGTRDFKKSVIDAQILELFGNEKSGELVPQRTKMTEFLDGIFFAENVLKASLPETNLNKNLFEKILDKSKSLYDVSRLFQAYPEYNNLDAKEKRQMFDQLFGLNLYLKLSSCMEASFDGWKQVVEISLMKCSDDISARVLCDIADTILSKFGSDHVGLTLLDSMSDVVLRIIAKQKQVNDNQNQHLLRGILAAMMRPSLPVMAKVNLYGALLYFLRQAKLYEFEDRHLYKIANDAVNGNDVLKATAFALLDSLVSLDPTYVKLLEQKGYLRVYFESISSFGTLIKLLDDPSSKMSTFIVYESIMSFFVAVSKNTEGSTNRIMISKFESLDFIGANLTTENTARYNQLMTPIFTVISSTLLRHKKDMQIASIVCQFIQKHHKAISRVLKKQNNLAQLRLLTCIFYILNSYNHTQMIQIIESLSKYEKLFVVILASLKKKNGEDEVETIKNILGYFVLSTKRGANQVLDPPFSASVSQNDETSLYTLDCLLDTHFKFIAEKLSEKKKFDDSRQKHFEELEVIDRMIESSKFVIENSLLLLSKHLDVYLKKNLDENHAPKNDRGLSLNDQNKLKEEIKMSKFLDRISNYERDNREFVRSNFGETLLARIRSLFE